jgi:hypothetical protein
MAKKLTYYMKLDEDFLQDPEVQLFIAEKGKEAVFDYIGLLLLMRDYRKTDYMIPWAMLPILARSSLMTTPEKLEDTVRYCIKIGFLRVYEECGDKYVYSERRQLDLRTWQVTQSKRSAAGIIGNQVRWNRERQEEENLEEAQEDGTNNES